MMGKPPLRTEHQLADRRVMTVRADDHVDLPRRAVLELDPDAPSIVRNDGVHRVAEDHFGVIGDGPKQDAHQVVSHDLDLAITSCFVQWSQRHVVGAPAIGPHGRQGHDPGAGLAHRGGKSHSFGDAESRAADVDGVPAHPQLGHPLDEDRPVTPPRQPVRQSRTGDARTGDQDRQRALHSAKIRG